MIKLATPENVVAAMGKDGKPAWRMVLLSAHGGRVRVVSRYDTRIVEVARRYGGHFDFPSRAWQFGHSGAQLFARDLSAVGYTVLASQEVLDALEANNTRADASRALDTEQAGRAGLDVDGAAARARAMLAPGVELSPYQLACLAFVEAAGGRALIFDSPGLGKTAESLSFWATRSTRPTLLVVTPAVVKAQWRAEVEKFTGAEATVLSGLGADAPGAQVRIVNYELLARGYEPKKSKDGRDLGGTVHLAPAEMVVFDECQRIGAPTSKTAKACRALARQARYVLALSGTPFQNNVAELWTTLDCVRPEEFPSRWKFLTRYASAHKGRFGFVTGAPSNIDELRERLSTFMIRRSKEEVLAELPPLRIAKLVVEIDELDSFLRRERSVLGEIQRLQREREARRAQKLGQMDEDQRFRYLNSAITALTALRQELGMRKVPAVVEWAQSFLAQGNESLVIFAHHRDVIRLIVEGLADYRPVEITGGQQPADRQAAIDAFQAGRARICVASLRAAGIGIQLTRAQTCLLAEQDFVPAVENQAISRLHRRGQTGSVLALVVCARRTIDERIFKLHDAKTFASGAVLDGLYDEAASDAAAVLRLVESLHDEARDDLARLVVGAEEAVAIIGNAHPHLDAALERARNALKE